jgi:DNA-directed RNA polymerase subunit RPC12/RpoP
MPNYECPECGNRGEPGIMIPRPYAFQVRGRVKGKHVYKCGRCGTGLQRQGLLSTKLAKISTDTWMEMERSWERAFPNG